MITSYLVWYRLEGDDHDRIAGLSHSYTAGVGMAENIYAIKKTIDKLPVTSTGVKLCQVGNLYSHENFDQRWQVVPLKTAPKKSPSFP
jgi:hypothetical protein